MSESNGSPEVPDTPDDVTSDPALDDENPSDWSGEGGAVPEGPATKPDDGHPHGAEEQSP